MQLVLITVILSILGIVIWIVGAAKKKVLYILGMVLTLATCLFIITPLAIAFLQGIWDGYNFSYYNNQARNNLELAQKLGNVELAQEAVQAAQRSIEYAASEKAKNTALQTFQDAKKLKDYLTR